MADTYPQPEASPTGHNELARRAAVFAGRGVERLAGIVIDVLEDVSLRVLEKTAPEDGTAAGSPDVVSVLGELRARTASLPHDLGRIAAGSVYLGIRFASIVVRAGWETMREGARLVDTKVTPTESDQ